MRGTIRAGKRSITLRMRRSSTLKMAAKTGCVECVAAAATADEVTLRGYTLPRFCYTIGISA